MGIHDVRNTDLVNSFHERKRRSSTSTRLPMALAAAGDMFMALCNDGTIWITSLKDDGWVEVPGIPQPTLPENKP